MGRHFKTDENITKENLDEYYKERIKRLEAENMNLSHELNVLRHKLDMKDRVIGELKQEVAEKAGELAKLKEVLIEQMMGKR